MFTVPMVKNSIIAIIVAVVVVAGGIGYRGGGQSGTFDYTGNSSIMITIFFLPQGPSSTVILQFMAMVQSAHLAMKFHTQEMSIR